MYTVVPGMAYLVSVSGTLHKRVTDEADGATGDLNLRQLVSPPVLM